MLAADGWIPRMAGDLLVAQLFEMSQGEHLAIRRVQAIDRVTHVSHDLGPLGCLAGRREICR